MTTRGCADVVFCLDASKSMKPCFDGVRQHLSAFLSGLKSRGQTAWDLRVDFVAYSTGTAEGGGVLLRHSSMFHEDLRGALYGGDAQSARFFTTDLDLFGEKIGSIHCEGDEASMVALDFALDFPWRPASKCHRIVILMTDEKFETGKVIEDQRAAIPQLVEKIQKLRVMLFLVAPLSRGFEELTKVEKSEYEAVDIKEKGLGDLDFKRVLESIGKSVSSSQQGNEAAGVKRGLFGQSEWVSSQGRFEGA
jgi:hypothetical protein